MRGVWLTLVFLAWSSWGHAQGLAEGTLAARAMLKPLRFTTLSSQLDARISELALDEGESFRENDPLVRFDCALQEARVAEAQAEVLSTEKVRDANLRLKKFGSVSELDLAVSETAVVKAQAALQVLQTAMAGCVISAPFAGVVVKRHAQPFQFLSEGAAVLDIHDPESLYVQLLLPSAWMRWLKVGAVFSVSLEETGKRYKAKVTRLGARVDPVSQTIEVRGRFSEPVTGLLAGMSGTALFPPPGAVRE